MENRLTDLETRISFQEQAIAELSDEVARQQRTVEALERSVRQLKDQLRLVLPSLVVPSSQETPPPHY